MWSLRSRAGVLVVAGVLCGPALAQSDIDPAHKYAWAENVGWLNFADADGGQGGIRVENSFLSGFIWSQSAGWINAGDGPDDGVRYTNTGTDHGVNIDPGTGDLFGYAWGENIGWVNFDTRASLSALGLQARVDLEAMRFRGYTWAASAGWINMDHDENYVGIGGCPADLDGDGDADAEDFFAYLDAFAIGDVGVCDIDGDGDCDAEDFFGYLDLFTQAC